MPLLTCFQQYLRAAAPLLLFLLAPWNASAQKILSAGADCQIAQTAMGTASRLRGLRIVEQIPCRLQSKAAVEDYLRASVSKKMSKDRIEREGRVYIILGFLPADYDYFDNVIKLYTDQIGGYYDPEKKYYAMADWMPSVIQMPIAVHELTHGLQDQHFDLEKMMDQAKLSSDTLSARSALVEGDATAVMLDYTRAAAGRPPLSKERSVSLFMIQNLSGALLSQSLREAPPALQASLLFPYVSGLNFAHALLRKGGYKEIDRALRNPPASTEEILHPEQYMERRSGFTKLADPPPPGDQDGGEKPVFSDTLGEFFISTLLATWLPPQQASDAAGGWDGDRVALYGKEEAWRLSWDFSWDSDAEAEQFFHALVQAYTVRFQAASSGPAEEASFSDDRYGHYTITVKGRRASLRWTGSQAGARKGQATGG